MGTWDVALEHLFQGSALNAVDAKGRVSVPAFLRSVIERRGDARTITLAKHEVFPALSAYDPAYAALKYAKLERLAEITVPEDHIPRIELLILALDPSRSQYAAGDMAGAIFVGRGSDGKLWVLGDASTTAPPLAWAQKFSAAANAARVDAVFYESNRLSAEFIETIQSAFTVPFIGRAATAKKFVRHCSFEISAGLTSSVTSVATATSAGRYFARGFLSFSGLPVYGPEPHPGAAAAPTAMVSTIPSRSMSFAA